MANCKGTILIQKFTINDNGVFVPCGFNRYVHRKNAKDGLSWFLKNALELDENNFVNKIKEHKEPSPFESRTFHYYMIEEEDRLDKYDRFDGCDGFMASVYN